MAYTSMPRPIKTSVGAKRVLLKLYISGLNTFGSSLPPPLIRINPKAIQARPINIHR
jgi:hypothetical protein